MTSKIKLPEGMTSDMCQWLENLRASGVINMFEAGQPLQDMYDLTRNAAREYHMFWMKNYDQLKEAGIIERDAG